MTSPSNPQDPYRRIAEILWRWAAMPHYYSYDNQARVAVRRRCKEEWLTEVASAIRDHTIFPEMLEFMRRIASGNIEDMIERKTELAEEAKSILAKKKG